MAAGAQVIRQDVFGVENGNDGKTFAFIHTGKYGADTHRDAAVIPNGFDGGLGGVTRGDRGGQHQHMLAHDHGGGIVPEQQLAAAGMLGGNHIDGAVGVHVRNAGPGQLAGHARAHDLRAVQAQDGIDDGGGVVIGCQFKGGFPGFGQAVLGEGEVDVIIDMAVAGGKVAVGHAQRQVGIGARVFDQLNRHADSLLL